MVPSLLAPNGFDESSDNALGTSGLGLGLADQGDRGDGSDCDDGGSFQCSHAEFLRLIMQLLNC